MRGGRQFSARPPRSGEGAYGSKFRGSHNSYRDGEFAFDRRNFVVNSVTYSTFFALFSGNFWAYESDDRGGYGGFNKGPRARYPPRSPDRFGNHSHDRSSSDKRVSFQLSGCTCWPTFLHGRFLFTPSNCCRLPREMIRCRENVHVMK